MLLKYYCTEHKYKLSKNTEVFTLTKLYDYIYKINF